MDTTFLVDDVTRANFLRSVMQSFGCTYVCLWSYLQPPNCLLFWDGLYNEENNQAQRLFHQYCQSVFPVSNYDCVPGLAFKNSQQYIELNESELQRLASNETQRQFYQEARIKINMEMEMRNLFPVQDLSGQSPARELNLPLPTDPNRPSSSSSSLRSLSMDSQDSSSLMFNIPSTTHLPETLKEVPHPLPPIIPTTTSPHQQAMRAFAQIRNLQLPTPESEDAVMTRAILAVLTASSSSPSSSTSSSHHQPQPNLPAAYRITPKASAFKNYNLGLAPSTSQMRTSLRAQSMLKRAISFYKRLNVARREHTLASRPTSTQLHHMISERKRREKLNESFLALRSLLPPGTKKDKASLLISTREHLRSLKAQVAELSERNQKLEAQLLPAASTSTEEAAVEAASGSTAANQRLDIRITPVPESTLEDRIIDLGLIVTAESPMLDLVIRVLEFLKQVRNNVSLVSMEANSRIPESASFNHLIFRLRIIQGSDWDEPAFREAVRRVVADLAQ
ncbi:hypothetical protein JRO89_XS04G0205900 [Xanthoceras sorbifolium]|uniref:BHLH domain-containing protein n=1 Tax=Xanthoceras sorbifolium TaxID=99658 RepID=A0ABQ8I657_9ROSI|nr:hypothetical protein JRO89_XS04G0205900 [Xanthoceras sorbifolium]